MQGTGTQADPYIVMNVDEFMEAASQNSNAYIKLGADINMDGVQNQLVQFAELDGDGHKIINMTTNSPAGTYNYVLRIQSANSTVLIRNIDFSSALINTNSYLILFYPTYSALDATFENCKFSVRINKTTGYTTNLFANGLSNRAVRIFVQRCVFDIKYDSTTVFESLTGSNITFHRIQDSHFEMHINVNGSSNSSNALLICNEFRNTYITGSLNNPVSTGTGQSIIKGSFYHTYAAIESGARGKIALFDVTAYDTCFYDRQKWDGGTDIAITHNGLLYGLPTEKCKDADYLNSIGFYVVPEE